MSSVPRSRYVCFGLLAACALAWDLLSKSWVFASLGYPYRSSEWEWGCPLLWGDFHIQIFTTFNQGALFGVGQGWSTVFAGVSVVAACGILFWLFVKGEARSWWLTVTLALIFAGALGNLYDRLNLHACVEPVTGEPLTGVRDFIKCDIPLVRYRFPAQFELLRRYEWPVFNFADTYLVTGAIMLTLYSLAVPQPQAKTGSAEKPAAASVAAPPPVHFADAAASAAR